MIVELFGPCCIDLNAELLFSIAEIDFLQRGRSGGKFPEFLQLKASAAPVL